jgi:hypothetical protein
VKDFVFREVWMPIDVNGDGEASTKDGNTPLIYKGAEVMFRLALFDVMPVDEDEPGEFRNHANLVSLLLRIRSGSYAGTVLLDSSTGTVSFDATATPAQFMAKEKAPISIHLPSAITGITAGDQYMVFSGVTSEGAEPDVFGRSRVSVLDVGIGGGSVPEPAESFVTMADFRAALQGVVKYGKNPKGKTVTLVSRSGSKGRTMGCDDDGNAMSVKEVY